MHLPSLIQFLLSTALITIPHPLFSCSLVPSHYPRIAFHVLVLFTVSTTTFCSQVCHMVSLVVVLSVNVIHMVAMCCTCHATPFFFHHECIVFWVPPPFLSLYFLSIGRICSAICRRPCCLRTFAQWYQIVLSGGPTSLSSVFFCRFSSHMFSNN